MSREGRREGKTAAKQRLFIGQLMDTRRVTEYSLETHDDDELVCFMIRPTNLSVLSESSVGVRVYVPINVLKGVTGIKILCLNNREDLKKDKRFLCRWTRERHNPAIRQLLERDQIFLDRIQIRMATAREFLIPTRLRNQRGKGVFSYLGRTGKSLKEQGFDSRRVDEEGIKWILAVYYRQNMVSEKFEDLDGAWWAIPDD